MVLNSIKEVARQRLIYAGHCLEDARTLTEVLRGRCEEASAAISGGAPAEPQVIHMVCASKEALAGVLNKKPQSSAATSGNSANGGELRRRVNAAANGNNANT